MFLESTACSSRVVSLPLAPMRLVGSGSSRGAGTGLAPLLGGFCLVSLLWEIVRTRISSHFQSFHPQLIELYRLQQSFARPRKKPMSQESQLTELRAMATKTLEARFEHLTVNDENEPINSVSTMLKSKASQDVKRLYTCV